MLKRFVFVFTVLALAVASAETWRVTLSQPSVVQGTELKAGDYRVELKDAKVVFASGNKTVEANVKVENAEKKYAATSIRFANAGGKAELQEIRLGGTRTKLVFNP